MATATMEDKQVQYSPVLDGDAVEAAQAIQAAIKQYEDASENLESKLLQTPVIYLALRTTKAADIAKKAGVSRTTIGIWARIGRILTFAPSAGVKPSEVRKLCNTAHNNGGLETNVDEVLDKYNESTDNPTWAGAMAAIRKGMAKPTTPKTDSQKADSHIKALQDLVSKKGLVLSTEQISALSTLTK